MTHTFILHLGKAFAISNSHFRPLSQSTGVHDKMSCVTIAASRRSTAAPLALITAAVAH